jgi:hypothetical protein
MDFITTDQIVLPHYMGQIGRVSTQLCQSTIRTSFDEKTLLDGMLESVGDISPYQAHAMSGRSSPAMTIIVNRNAGLILRQICRISL